MIDLTPGRRSIQARYGTPPPRPALAAILARYTAGPETVAAILQELARAEARYHRAVKIEAHRRRVERFDLARVPEADLAPRAQKALARSRAVLANAAAYLDGDWTP